MIKKRIIFLIYDGFELLDLAGPSSVFNAVSSIPCETIYQSVVVSELGGYIEASCGVELNSVSLKELTINHSDTVLTTGANQASLLKVLKNTSIKKWLNQANMQSERIGSICSGSFLLAETGLLNNKQATTHWLLIDQFQSDFPKIKVNTKAMYVNDGKFWSSAGVSTGIDMALELVRQDCGSHVMGMVAKGLVVYKHRPGHQSQFSQLLNFQIKANNDFYDLISWVSNNLQHVIKVEHMSDIAHMSKRTFHRKFTQSFGLTPAKFVEQARLSRAKELLDENLSIKQVLLMSGFRSEAGFRKLFNAYFGINPGMYKKIHGQSTSHI